MANMIQIDRSDIFSAARKLDFVGGSIVTLMMEAVYKDTARCVATAAALADVLCRSTVKAVPYIETPAVLGSLSFCKAVINVDGPDAVFRSSGLRVMQCLIDIYLHTDDARRKPIVEIRRDLMEAFGELVDWWRCWNTYERELKELLPEAEPSIPKPAIREAE